MLQKQVSQVRKSEIGEKRSLSEVRDANSIKRESSTSTL